MSFAKPMSFANILKCGLVIAGLYWLTHRGTGGGPDYMANLLRRKLVTATSGGGEMYNDNRLAAKKYIGLYYSASWCGPCRRFTPQLVQFYKQNVAAHPEFEIVFISSDRSVVEMAGYMQQDGMPWAALLFGLKGQEKELMRYAGSGIPDLVVVDASGKVISDSFQGSRYVGPYKVLDDLRGLLAKGR